MKCQLCNLELVDGECPNDNHEQSPVTSYFTFGQGHVHRVGDRVFDRDTVAKITSMDPRADMVRQFGTKWAFEYDKLPDMRYFPKGVIEL